MALARTVRQKFFFLIGRKRRFLAGRNEGTGRE